MSLQCPSEVRGADGSSDGSSPPLICYPLNAWASRPRPLLCLQAANGRDDFGAGNKFITPTIADGQVYVGTTTGVGVFGLLNQSTPTIVLTSPIDGASYKAPANITLTASVAANGHSVSKVQFYNGASLLAQDATAPYSFTWKGVPAGSYTLTARLIYDASSTLDSAPVNITVVKRGHR
jgi:hypothetical protein